MDNDSSHYIRRYQRRPTESIEIEQLARRSLNNHDFDFNNMNNELQNFSSIFKSEDSDINKNELVPMVTVHANVNGNTNVNGDNLNTEEPIQEDGADTQQLETSFINELSTNLVQQEDKIT